MREATASQEEPAAAQAEAPSEDAPWSSSSPLERASETSTSEADLVAEARRKAGEAFLNKALAQATKVRRHMGTLSRSPRLPLCMAPGMRPLRPANTHALRVLPRRPLHGLTHDFPPLSGLPLHGGILLGGRPRGAAMHSPSRRGLFSLLDARRVV